MHKIYIVEDDTAIASSIAAFLRTWQMQTVTVSDFQNVLVEIEHEQPELILMDIKLPYYNGFYWCTEIRKTSQVPIIFLSSADDNMNIVMAMNMGADDFIAKPFDLNVLAAKIQAVLRRSYGMKLAAHTLSCCGLKLNLDETTVSYDGTQIDLTKNEFLILSSLMQKQGTIVSRETLMEKLWGNDEFIDDNTLTVNMGRIRKKLDAVGCVHFIETKRGLGYLVRDTESKEPRL